MQKGFIKYCLTLFILLFSGYSYLSATSIDLNGSNDASSNSIHQHGNFTFKSPVSGLDHKIDLAENEIEEDESDLPIRFLESYNYAPDFNAQAAGCSIHNSKKEIPFYLIFCTIRI